MSAQDVINAVNTLRAQATSLVNTVSVPLSSLQAYASQAAASAAAAAQSAIDAANNAGGNPGGGSGGSGANTMLVKVKSALAASPANYSAIPRTSTPVLTASGKSVPSAYGSNYIRHWLNGTSGSNGSGDLGTITVRMSQTNIGPVLGGGINFNTDDGSSSTQWNSQKGNLTDFAADWSGCFYGFNYTGRRFSYNHQSFSGSSVMVDGNLVNTYGSGPEGYITVDLGSTGNRNIVIRGNPDFWHSELITESSATVTPYNPLSGGKLKVAFSGDSYSYAQSYSQNGLGFLEAVTAMIGGGHWIASAAGGTGFSSNNQDTSLRNAIHADRLALVNTYGADVIFAICSINDGWPSSPVKTLDTDGTTVITTTVDTQTAMQTWLSSVRAANPNSVIVMVTPWAPKQSYITAGSTYLLKRDAMVSLLSSVSGPWIFMDGLVGRWATSANTNSGSGTGPWITGDGNTANPTGTGNADTWIGDDTVHPTSAGAIGLATYMVNYFRAAIASMPTT